MHMPRTAKRNTLWVAADASVWGDFFGRKHPPHAACARAHAVRDGTGIAACDADERDAVESAAQPWHP